MTPNDNVFWGIGYDTTTAIDYERCTPAHPGWEANVYGTAESWWRSIPTAGYHYLAALEATRTSTTLQVYANVQSFSGGAIVRRGFIQVNMRK